MISDFQWALIIIALFIVIGVVFYNRWQEAKYKKQAEQAFWSRHHDVLLQEPAGSDNGNPGRVEPSLGDLADMPATRADDLDLMGFDTPTVPLPIMPKTAGNGQLPGINAAIDTIAVLLATTPIMPEQFWPTVQQSARVSKRIIWEGLTGELWQPIDAHNADDGVGYRELRAGLQLASRSGPIDTTTLLAFNQMMTSFAERIGAVSQREDPQQAGERAGHVDNFCADTDIEIVVNIVGKDGATFGTTKVRGLAEAEGMVAQDNGEYVMTNPLGQALFSLRNLNPSEPTGFKRAGGYLTGLTFALDVPRAAQPAAVFGQMMTVALRFADTLQGDVVDDNRRLLTANGRKVIGETIVSIAGSMEARGVTPGSSAALRLYA